MDPISKGDVESAVPAPNITKHVTDDVSDMDFGTNDENHITNEVSDREFGSIPENHVPK
jgi:hypothetical protein